MALDGYALDPLSHNVHRTVCSQHVTLVDRCTMSFHGSKWLLSVLNDDTGIEESNSCGAAERLQQVESCAFGVPLGNDPKTVRVKASLRMLRLLDVNKFACSSFPSKDVSNDVSAATANSNAQPGHLRWIHWMQDVFALQLILSSGTMRDQLNSFHLRCIRKCDVFDLHSSTRTPVRLTSFQNVQVLICLERPQRVVHLLLRCQGDYDTCMSLIDTLLCSMGWVIELIQHRIDGLHDRTQ